MAGLLRFVILRGQEAVGVGAGQGRAPGAHLLTAMHAWCLLQERLEKGDVKYRVSGLEQMPQRAEGREITSASNI